MAEEKKLYIPVAADKRICTMCHKEFDKEPLLVKDWDMCPECRKTYGDMAYIYCNTCKAIVSRATPGLIDGWYLLKPGDILHVNECPVCHPGIVKSIPVEMQGHETGR